MGSITADFYASELRRARLAANLSQETLAQAIAYSPSLVTMVENGRRAPSIDFTKRCDEALGTGGLLGRILEDLLTKDVTPEWFRPWVVVEQEATSLWTYELALVPGLLQTEAYARVLLNNDETKVVARLDRQKVLTREKPPPPAMVTLIDERVLHHPVGDATVMREQVAHLAAAVSPNHRIQVVPVSTGTYHHLDGPFVIATLEGRELAFLETAARGFVIEDRELVSQLRWRWDTIRSEALPVGQSVELIEKVAQQWT